MNCAHENLSVERYIPGIKTSSGHEYFMSLSNGLFHDERGTEEPQFSSGNLAWELFVEFPKKIASTPTAYQSRYGVIDRFKDRAVSFVRTNPIIIGALMGEYRQALLDLDAEELPDAIISSHTMPLVEIPEGVLQKKQIATVRLEIDMFPKGISPQIIDGHMVFLTPNKTATNSLIHQGIGENRIIETGLIVDEDIFVAYEERKHNITELIDEGKKVERKALITVGGSMPEREQVLESVDYLVGQGIQTKVILGPDQGELKEMILNVLRNKNVKVKYQTDEDMLREYKIEIESHDDRDSEVDAFIEALKDKSLTTVITRPNQNQWLAALGLEVVLLRPFQEHEVKAYSWFQQNLPTGIHILDKIKSPFPQDTRYDISLPESGEYWNEVVDPKWIKVCKPEDAKRAVAKAIKTSSQICRENVIRSLGLDVDDV
ncbi:hypothetical protein JW978_01255 [Candidatus Dojkabacteria bacterium]|nr:hypothetical protein [Candidatus Dojkabacteria bacterium]